MLFMGNAFGWVFYLSIGKSFQRDFCFAFFTHIHKLQLTNGIEQIYWHCMSIDLAAEKLLSVSSWLIGIAHLEFGHDWRFFCHKMHLSSNGFERFENRYMKNETLMSRMNRQTACTWWQHFLTCSILTKVLWILNSCRDKAIVTDCCQVILETKCF